MRMHSWLTNLYQKLAGSPIGASLRPHHRRSLTTPAVIERLDSRRLLSAMAIGPETRVDSHTTGDKTSPAIASDAVGDYVTVWQSDGLDIFARRYNSAGVAQGSEFQVNTYTTGAQNEPSIAMDAAGDFVIAWQSPGQNNSIEAQRYNSAGTAVGSEFKVQTDAFSVHGQPSVAMDSSGNFAIAYSANTPGGSFYDIYVRRYNAAGVAQGPQFQVNTYTTNSQLSPSAAMDAAGDLLIAWESFGQDGSGYGIYAQRYSPVGATVGSEFRVNSSTASNQRYPSAAMASNAFVIVWQSLGQDGSGYGIYSNRYDSLGVPQGEARVNSYTTNNQTAPSVSMDALGDFVVVYQQDQGGADNNSVGIVANEFVLSGTLKASHVVNTFTTGAQANPRVAMDASGDFVATWQSNGQWSAQNDIYSTLCHNGWPDCHFS